MALYFATVLPGLEDILMQEIRCKMADAKLQGSERGKVYFADAQSPEMFPMLRTADNLYRLLHRFPVGPHKADLDLLARDISKIDLPIGRGERGETIGYQVHASRVGKHTYSRFDAADAAARGISRRYGRHLRRDAESHAVEYRLDIVRDQAAFALRLTDAAYRYRGLQRTFTRAALRPTVAHALVWLSQPKPSDRLIDPCCGSGTLLSERLAYPFAHLAGGDRSEEAVAAAISNVGIRDDVRIRRWDARQLPVDAGSADKMTANLPFGRQIAADMPLAELYGGMMSEMRRVLTPGGQAIVLTDADDALQEAAARTQLRVTKAATLSLKGLHPAIYLLAKR
ncbi:methyltransferase domain-containing protein [Cohnella nanjingensis]|uniref:Methyltransferase domain-containing protein n=1 Tax=Cohnella nanjingensis TaxID=1387779 RepID=A0A7X0RTY1_9BACL|nr:methyltransferase domain-containing protein [Cohnella nanjingensis]MBB6672421.1 methyltransferase domain-containing protein [Cohnella nanjingensis]